MKSCCLLALLWPFFSGAGPLSASQPLQLAQNEISGAFDPFIDYGDFQDNVTEEENIDFFQNGRSLTMSMSGGYEALSLNMRQIYGDAPIFGAGVGFFLDLRFAFQVSGVFPAGHYNSLLSSTSSFSHFGIDLKYYLNRQYISEDADFFNPYFIFGPFWINIKSQIPRLPPPSIPITNAPTDPSVSTSQNNLNLSLQELTALSSWNAAGIKVGAGLEVPLIKQSFVGVEISYLYTVLEHENQDLTLLDLPPSNFNPNQSLLDRLLFPNRPQVEGWRFFGDLINIVILLGVNF